MQNRVKTNNGDIASAFHKRLVGLRKVQGTKYEVAALWGVPLITVYSLEKVLNRTLQTIARHGDRLGVIITYDVKLKREDGRGNAVRTPVE